MILSSNFHLPVLLPQVLEGLKVEPENKYVDATIGGGGYSFEIIKRGGIVLGIDADEDALSFVRNKFGINKKLFLEHGNFADLKRIAEKYGFKRIAGIVFDLGMSSFQLGEAGRGFSYKLDEPLDMRMDKRGSITAADIINKCSQEQLYEIFTKYAEEVHSRTIASAILRARTIKNTIQTTGDLVVVIDQVLNKIYGNKQPNQFKKFRNKTLGRIFQALRIQVNNELVNLKKGIDAAADLLKTDGRLLVISYHSLEDRIVKLKFKEKMRQGMFSIITKQPITASVDEIDQNPKAHSAKLRIAQKLKC